MGKNKVRAPTLGATLQNTQVSGLTIIFMVMGHMSGEMGENSDRIVVGQPSEEFW